MRSEVSIEPSPPTPAYCGILGTGRVLVIEDDADLREVLDILIEIEGCDVRSAPDGATGLKIALSWMPDLILLDYSMPGMTGGDFVRAYQQAPEPHAPILLLTGRDGGKQLAQELGVAGQLPKPFSADGLRKAMAEFVDCSE